MLRCGLQQGRSVIAKSTKPSRIAENIDVFDFDLTSDEMAAIDRLDTGRRGGPDPDAITLEAFGRDTPRGLADSSPAGRRASTAPRGAIPADAAVGAVRPAPRLLRSQPRATVASLRVVRVGRQG